MTNSEKIIELELELSLIDEIQNKAKSSCITESEVIEEALKSIERYNEYIKGLEKTFQDRVDLAKLSPGIR